LSGYFIIVVQAAVRRVVVHPSAFRRGWRRCQSVDPGGRKRVRHRVNRNARRHLTIAVDFRGNEKRLVEIEGCRKRRDGGELNGKRTLVNRNRGLRFGPNGDTTRRSRVQTERERIISGQRRTRRTLQSSLIPHGLWDVGVGELDKRRLSNAKKHCNRNDKSNSALAPITE